MNEQQQTGLKELRKTEDAAAREYLELRDAKSNGCCHGLSIMDVLAYDARIMKAADKLKAAQDAVIKYIEEATECK